MSTQAPSLDKAFASVLNTIIGQMETCGLDWKKPWVEVINSTQNAVTGKPYTGVVNTMLLSFAAIQRDYSESYWAGYKQWLKIGAKVRKGEKGIWILLPKMARVEEKETGEEKVFCIGFIEVPVFNITQADNVDRSKLKLLEDPLAGKIAFELESELESWVTLTFADIRHGQGYAAYNPVKDFIRMPDAIKFHSKEGYYATLLHELTHWTKHPTRLNRKSGAGFDKSTYAFEELIAELGSAFLCSTNGISEEPRENHAQYLKGWLTALKSDRGIEYLTEAAHKAQQAVNFLNRCVNSNKEARVAQNV